MTQRNLAILTKKLKYLIPASGPKVMVNHTGAKIRAVSIVAIKAAGSRGQSIHSLGERA